MKRTNCVYCGNPITTPSREHVIQNALGGMYESVDICCPECNNYVSKYIDAPFTKIFNPILGRIDNLAKTHSTAGVSYRGTIRYNGKTYPAFFKDKKIASCPELSRELKCDIKNLDLKPESFNFDLPNDAFKNGIAKIAFNYALDYGIDLDKLSHGLNVTRDSHGTINNISFTYPLIPFVPLNAVDKHIELNTEPELYHNMILFSECNTLWCYIDLFNTFQYYVLLSDKWDSSQHVYNNYAQYLNKNDASIVDDLTKDWEWLRQKDIYLIAQTYNIEPTMDRDLFRDRLTQSIMSKSRKQPLEKIIYKKIQSFSPFDYCINANPDELLTMYHALNIYADDKNGLHTKNFRTVTPTPDGHLVSYTWLINELIIRNQLHPHKYTWAKFERLNKYLSK